MRHNPSTKSLKMSGYVYPPPVRIHRTGALDDVIKLSISPAVYICRSPPHLANLHLHQ